MGKPVREIRNELLKIYLDLEASYIESGNDQAKIDYLDIQMCEHLMNSIKSLEYHYAEESPLMRIKKNWNLELKNAEKILKKYGEIQEGKFKLQEKFDTSGYVKYIDFLEGLIE
jgi:hypothetical protein